MGMSVGGSETLNAEPNLTPMIDVLLVLLVIFMMIIPMSRKAIDVQLPDPNPPVTNAAPNVNQIVLEVLPGEKYAVNTEEVPKDRLLARLKEIYDPRPEKIIFIKGHPDVLYQDVIFAMDVSRGAGVKVIGAAPKANP